ncbi:PREDICTED: uncharacterized protein LOC109590077, partial [Amphimedon queenslandica]|uniref:Uncharacterized protein n=1 Tax=Amphimedon queenslandica TaxID=400682 RepID=A0AAN0JXB4_AMPQE
MSGYRSSRHFLSSLSHSVDALRSDLNQKDEIIKETMAKVLELTSVTNAQKAGKSFDDVGKRQQRRKIMAIKEATKKALLFLDSFKIDAQSIILKSQVSKETMTIPLSSSSHTKSSINTSSCSSENTIDEVLFLLDSYGISDEFYHELSMIHTSLPRSYLVKQRRNNISTNIPSYRLPKPYFGCYRSLKESIIEETIQSP